jgi:hypothetical protein
MHLWPTAKRSSTPNSDWEQLPPTYSTPTTRRQLPNFAREETPTNTIPGSLLDPQWDPQNTHSKLLLTLNQAYYSMEAG